MTHDHSLDFSLTQRIMRREDFAYFGLIGSKTKRVKFERRLIERGVAADRLPEITCPIGVEGIVDKAPWSIALAVTAQLLRVREMTARMGAPSMNRSRVLTAAAR
ncbi:XdhC protein (assists in molybdopterin insertion into xanthine dehydrogenase) [Candidatus Burkholderia verschuerenii]|uniref:XdhC protein (Assists in molybdopterin insertion into xanthine dehydrogenase) n=2 Tax=Candidatus Burkholderia verschuerenii TaxID=242163 RepID=A0A0L0MB34_9BURK|nr:XdhC protein (assists in molybdopterin insertion into xanthine dehydrogenase) [Candidatus Burkholderia verschuerenii]